jgi:hypothetical protein
MLTKILIIVGIAAFGYFKRHGFRRAWYVLRTGKEKVDWKSLGEDYFLAPWEKKRMNRSAQRKEDQAQKVSE